MIDNVSFLEIRAKYKKRSQILPDFIDNKSEIDYMVYGNMRAILDNIFKLFKDKFLNDDVIKTILDDSNELMDAIFQLLDVKGAKKNQFIKKQFLVSGYIINFVDDLSNELKAFELYEPLTNIKKFNDSFYRYE